jgi:hypothetical protein
MAVLTAPFTAVVDTEAAADWADAGAPACVDEGAVTACLGAKKKLKPNSTMPANTRKVISLAESLFIKVSFL